MQQQTARELVSFTPSTLIELFQLDGSVIDVDILYHFYDGSNNNYKPLVFDGIEYTPFPIKMEQVDKDGKGQPVRPKLTVSNINGFVSALLLGNSNLIGAKVSRKRVFVRTLDAVNFPNGVNPWGTPDPTAIVSNDVFCVNRKVQENPEVVEFELATPIEIDNVKLPRRQILATMGTCRYRDAETCGYSSLPVADKNNKSFTAAGPQGYGFTLVDKGAWSASTTYNQGDYVYRISTLTQTAGDKIFYVCNVNGTVGDKPSISTNWIADFCPKTIAGCKLRYPTGPLQIGNFPGISRSSFQS
jgi:lambda family phage minor tail protein L